MPPRSRSRPCVCGRLVCWPGMHADVRPGPRRTLMDNLEIVLMTIDELVDNGYALDGPSGPALPCVQLKRAPLGVDHFISRARVK